MNFKYIEIYKKPIVSIGLPVYNDAQYLPKAIEDLLGQTFKDFELIISDNASTDNTKNICREYAAKDRRISYYRQPHNLGIQGNFTYVLHQACGEFFMWAGSDDRWDRDFIKILINALISNESYVSAFCSFIYIDEENNPLEGELGGEKRYNFSSDSTLQRICKFNWTFESGRDAWIYGLHRKELIQDLKFPVWWSINSNTPLNTAYPVLTFFLSRGGYVLAGEYPLWFKRRSIDGQTRHNNQFLGNLLSPLIALLLRQVNLYYESIKAVYQGTISIHFTLVAIPILIARCLYTCIRETVIFIIHGIFRLRVKIFKKISNYL